MYLTVLAQVSFVYGAGDVFAKCTMDGTQVLHSQRKYPGIPTKKHHAQSKAWAGRLLQQLFFTNAMPVFSFALIAKNTNHLLRSFLA